MLRLSKAALVTVLTACGLTACVATQIDLPPIATSSGERHPGSFVWHDLISDDPVGSQRFYGELFGWTFEPLSVLPGKYWTISRDGEPIGGMVAQDSLRAQKDVSQWISLLSVTDAGAARSLIASSGGEVLREPVSLGSRGTVAVYADPQGALFATLTTVDGDPKAGVVPKQGDFLWHELWTSDVFAASPFYAALSDLSVDEGVSSAAASGVQYNVLRRDGEPVAAVRDLPDPEMPSLWMPFLKVDSPENLDALLVQVSQLGGRVLVPAVARPSRGYVAVVAGPSGAPLALQTWADDAPAIEEL
ncbi:MAG: VOC family protein [Pseudomonadota bacterium]